MWGCLIAILLLAIFFISMLLLRKAILRAPTETPDAELDKWEHKRGWPVGPLREGVRWYRTQTIQTVAVQSFDGLRLVGDYLPAEGTGRGRVILFHGYHGCLTDYAASLRLFHELGFDLLLPDQRAHGRSEGRFIGFGVLERRDCRTWAEEADRLWGEKPTFLAGVSMGASTVLMASGDVLPADVRGLLADCGFTSPREIVLRVLHRVMHLPTYPFYPVTNGLCRLLAGYGFGDYSTLDAMAVNRLPVLFFHGEADSFVPPEMSRRNYEACRAEKRLVMVPGAAHCQSFVRDYETCSRETAAFLNRWAGAGSAE